MRLIPALAMLLFVLPAAATATDLIGTIVPPYPEGTESRMGQCIEDASGDICAFSVSTLNANDGTVVAILAKALSHRVEGTAHWHVLDVHDAPQLEEGQMWAIEECVKDGTPDPATIGIVAYRDMGGWIETGETVWAIRFDRESQKLTELDPDAVECILPGS